MFILGQAKALTSNLAEDSRFAGSWECDVERISGIAVLGCGNSKFDLLRRLGIAQFAPTPAAAKRGFAVWLGPAARSMFREP